MNISLALPQAITLNVISVYLLKVMGSIPVIYGRQRIGISD